MEHLLSSLLLVFLAGCFGFQMSASQLRAEGGAEGDSKRRTNCDMFYMFMTPARRQQRSADCYVTLTSLRPAQSILSSGTLPRNLAQLCASVIGLSIQRAEIFSISSS